MHTEEFLLVIRIDGVSSLVNCGADIFEDRLKVDFQGLTTFVILAGIDVLQPVRQKGRVTFYPK
jgi:hypothetical protein